MSGQGNETRLPSTACTSIARTETVKIKVNHFLIFEKKKKRKTKRNGKTKVLVEKLKQFFDGVNIIKKSFLHSL